VRDEEIDRWSEASVLIWPVQLRLWLMYIAKLKDGPKRVKKIFSRI
jgi:hypothetical protein